MTLFYSGRHRAVQTSTAGRSAGLGVAAVAAAGIAAPAMIATSASAAPATVDTTTVKTTKSTKSTFTGTVRYGARGSTVKAIQRKVGVRADGIFGPATRSAVQRYQRRHNLVADGIVGTRTGTKMGLSRSSSGGGSGSSSSGSSSSGTTFSGLVRQGARGSIVRQIQRKVGTSADGVFGPATRSAVQRWQRSHGLTADGVVGPKTGSRMGLSGSSSGSTSGSTPKPGGNTSNSSVLGTAASYVGTRYRYGGTTPSGFDCSGFTQYVFAKHGKSLPRTTEAQRRATTRVSSPRPGDLVFFGGPAYHVGIYAGNGMMYDAGNSRTNVSKRAIWTSNVSYHRV
ncbi:MAG: C40 family peptidase [Janibacter sp.]